MTHTHYDDYPYPNPDQYSADQVAHLRTDNAPRQETWDQWFPGETPGPKRVLVIGCGMYEAIAVAAQEPLLDVLAIDSSAVTIERSSALAKGAGVENVAFRHRDVMAGSELELWGALKNFDLVIASGVMHHIEDEEDFSRRLSRLVRRGGIATIMVYGDCLRESLPKFCDMLRTLDIPRNAHGIDFVRGLIAALPPHHPVKAFARMLNDYDSNVVDVWLHPYFKQYGADELIGLMARHGLGFKRWLENIPTDYSMFENLPPAYRDVSQRFAHLSYPDKCRIGQIINYSDVKLNAVFQR